MSDAVRLSATLVNSAYEWNNHNEEIMTAIRTNLDAQIAERGLSENVGVCAEVVFLVVDHEGEETFKVSTQEKATHVSYRREEIWL